MQQPNIIVIVSDDQGYGDLSCAGSEGFETPYLDRLAASGVRLTDWYANSPVCSPTRAALLTGRYPLDVGVRDVVKGHRSSQGLPARLPTVASRMRSAGYRTYSCGKWHLGLAEGCRPQDHAFDHSFGFRSGCVDYFSHIFYWGMNRPGPGVNPTHDLWEDGREVWANGEYLTDLVTAKALEYLRDARDREQPFFLYLAYSAPHYPMHAPRRYIDRFDHLPPDRRIMAAMLSAMDDGIGRVLDELDTSGISRDTCVFFTSDNGPSRESRNWLDGNLDPYYGGSAGSFRGHKGSLFEGGIRVPGIVSWPARIPPAQVSSAPCATIDLAPTVLAVAGVDSEPEAFDGVDLLPNLADGEPAPDRDLYWEYGDQTAVRRGRWKLVLNPRESEESSLPQVWLSDLFTDPGERHNLHDAYPDVCAKLSQAAATWRTDREDAWLSATASERRDVEFSSAGAVWGEDPTT